ncbi:MAG: hypothetical protein KAG43_00210 [Candidatus Marithrix sp.]|nr:hypothetical protein [Candidatus Marithrix sp.]
MKITFDIEATPQELRVFFGLPDVEPLQNEMLEHIRKNMDAGMEGFEPATLIKPFIAEQMQSVTTIQKTFWNVVMGQLQSNKTEQ